jgi:hypothetical protein
MSNTYTWGPPEQPRKAQWIATDDAAVALLDDDLTQVAAEFAVLAEEWRKQTSHVSILAKRIVHPAYRRIIDLDWPVVPVILSELRIRPNFWFPALRAITGEDPVSPSDRGDLAKMTAAWLAWGLARGYPS